MTDDLRDSISHKTRAELHAESARYYAIIKAMAAVFERSESDVRSTVGDREGCILTIATETGVIPDPWSGFAEDYERWMEVQRRLESEHGCWWDSINPGLQCWYP